LPRRGEKKNALLIFLHGAHATGCGPLVLIADRWPGVGAGRGYVYTFCQSPVCVLLWELEGRTHSAYSQQTTRIDVRRHLDGDPFARYLPVCFDREDQTPPCFRSYPSPYVRQPRLQPDGPQTKTGSAGVRSANLPSRSGVLVGRAG
jgi:hypothetical protein